MFDDRIKKLAKKEARRLKNTQKNKNKSIFKMPLRTESVNVN